MSIESLREITHLIDNLNDEQAQTLDQWSEDVQSLLRSLVQQGGPAAQRVKDWLNGTWLGHALHPALTDVPLGAWWTGALLDVVGAGDQADAAMTVGVLAAFPTALAGAADWSDTEGQQRRNGLIHAMLNSAGLVCMISSLFARRHERRGLGMFLSTLGLGLGTFSAWIGGELVYREGAAVSRNAFEPTSDEFQSVMRLEALPDGKLTGAELTVEGQKVPVLLLRRGSDVMAIGEVCSHWGGPLAEGKLVEGDDGDCVECPWHGSTFRLADGSVVHGPAAVPQPTYAIRIRDGNIELRRR